MADDPVGGPKTVRRLKLAGLVGLCSGFLVIAAGSLVRYSDNREARADTTETSIPTVDLIRPTVSESAASLTLPGRVEALYSAPIYARASGYIRAWYKDIGAPVHKGDLLAVIDTPELDQQIEQAKADVADAVAAQKLAQSTAERWSGLLKLDAVSQQEADEKSSDLAAKTARAAAAHAALDRLNDLKSFARIVAPFDGIVTSRSVDIGALVNAGAQSSTALFTVADAHQVRVYVEVPQNYAGQIRPGLTAGLSLPQYPGRVFAAKLDSTSNAFSQQSNTLLVELLADNRANDLKPGEYAEVTFHIASGNTTLQLPASALTFRRQGLQVATVLPNNHVLMKSISIARDLGAEVDVNQGLSRQDRVIDNPPDSIVNGDVVRIGNGSGL